MRRMHPEAAGFTLVEMIIVIILLGILAGLGVQFVRPAVDAYSASIKRQGLTAEADLVARRLERDLHAALPNSLRVSAITSGFALEFIPVTGGGMYRVFPTTVTGSTGKDVLRFDGADSSFNVVGPAPVYASGQSLVISNLGEGSGSDAYAGTNRSVVSSSNNNASLFSSDDSPHTVAFGAIQFPVPSAASRFQIVDTPVTYVCDTAAKTLQRRANYGWNTLQVATPTGAATATLTNLLAPTTAGCTVRYASGSLTSRTGLVSVELRLTNSSGESLDMIVQVNVPNEP